METLLYPQLFLVEVNSKARSVTFKVKDRDYVGCDMLGWLAISVEELLEEDTISGWYVTNLFYQH